MSLWRTHFWWSSDWDQPICLPVPKRKGDCCSTPVNTNSHLLYSFFWCPKSQDLGGNSLLFFAGWDGCFSSVGYCKYLLIWLIIKWCFVDWLILVLGIFGKLKLLRAAAEMPCFIPRRDPEFSAFLEVGSSHQAEGWAGMGKKKFLLKEDFIFCEAQRFWLKGNLNESWQLGIETCSVKGRTSWSH